MACYTQLTDTHAHLLILMNIDLISTLLELLSSDMLLNKYQVCANCPLLACFSNFAKGLRIDCKKC